MMLSEITTASISTTLMLVFCLVAGNTAHGQTPLFIQGPQWSQSPVSEHPQWDERGFHSPPGRVVYSSSPVGNAVPPWFASTGNPPEQSIFPAAMGTSIEPEFSSDQWPTFMSTDPYTSQNLTRLNRAVLPPTSWSLQHMPDGLLYSDGHTSQLEFQRESEQLIGLGVWYDF